MRIPDTFIWVWRLLFKTCNKCWVHHGHDFLRRLVALIHSMRLSIMKGAHADLSSAAWQEIGVKPYFGLSGIPALDVPACFACCRKKRKLRGSQCHSRE